MLSVILLNSLFVVNYAYKQNATKRIHDNLEYTRRIFNQILHDRIKHLAENAHLLSSDYAFKQVVATSDRDTLISALENLVYRIGADVAMLVHPDGTLIADTSNPKKTGPFFDPSLIKRAARDGEAVSIVFLGTEPHQIAVVPVLAPDPISWLCISAKIGKNLVDEMTRLTQSRVSLVQTHPATKSTLIASSLPQNARRELLATLETTNVKSQQPILLQLDTTRYLSSASILLTGEGGSVIALLQKSLDQEMIPYYRLQWILLGIALTSLVIAVIGSFLVARSVSKPVRDLVAGTREIGHGNYDYRIRVDRADEIGELGSAFNEMAERRQLQEALGHAKEKAESDSRAKSEFLANMSHELRTPLNSILGYAQLLRKDSTRSNLDKAVTTIEQSGQQLLSLIDELLDLSRIEAGKMELHTTDFNLRLTLEKICDVMAARARAKGLSFHNEYPKDLPQWISGDEKRLRQIFTNLLDNAIKYTQKGAVSLRVDLIENRYRFSVKDSGIGIHPVDLKDIFRSFHQAHDKQTQVEGTGLGLAICDRLVKLMGGQIEVSSSPGQGSEFRFELPLAIPQQPAREQPTSGQKIIAVEGNNKRLLIADDNANNRSFLLDVLSPMNFELREAVNGQDCLQQTREWLPHILLLDIRMPLVGGAEVCRQIRTLQRPKDIVIIAISASAFEHHRKQCMEAGANAFLPKPLRIQVLMESLNRHADLEALYEVKSRRGLGQDCQATHPLPPRQRLEDLLAATKRGDIKAIRDQVKQIQGLDTQFAGFTTQLNFFADAFQLKKMREFLQQILTASEET